jgi:hypothetical protein
MTATGFTRYILANGTEIQFKSYPPMPGFINVPTSRGELKARGADYYIIWDSGFESILSAATFMQLSKGGREYGEEPAILGGATIKQNLEMPTNPRADETKLFVDEQGINVSDAARVPVVKKVEGQKDGGPVKLPEVDF